MVLLLSLKLNPRSRRPSNRHPLFIHPLRAAFLGRVTRAPRNGNFLHKIYRKRDPEATRGKYLKNARSLIISLLTRNPDIISISKQNRPQNAKKHSLSGKGGGLKHSAYYISQTESCKITRPSIESHITLLIDTARKSKSTKSPKTHPQRNQPSTLWRSRTFFPRSSGGGRIRGLGAQYRCGHRCNIFML